MQLCKYTWAWLPKNDCVNSHWQQYVVNACTNNEREGKQAFKDLKREKYIDSLDGLSGACVFVHLDLCIWKLDNNKVTFQ